MKWNTAESVRMLRADKGREAWAFADGRWAIVTARQWDYVGRAANMNAAQTECENYLRARGLLPQVKQ